ncbi:thiamine pyrophosphokinase [Thozetella sp. PMI_491]|nr:thiamine pyrophosphokinase [Thozetella sp. PMI_491]
MDSKHAEKPIEWHPGRLVRRPQQDPAAGAPADDQQPFALIMLNQPLHHLGVIRRLWKNSFTHVAADGGANYLCAASREGGQHSFADLEVIIGDLDSLTDESRAYFEQGPGRTRVIHNPDQYSTDFTKAVQYVRDMNASSVDIVALGGLGGRVDQGLSQIHHLYLFQKGSRYEEGRMYLVSGESITFLLKAGTHTIQVRDGGEEVFGKHVGIVPVKEPSVISTKGLEWDVTDWETEFGGQMSTSNHLLPETRDVEITTTKDVIFTIALRELD